MEKNLLPTINNNVSFDEELALTRAGINILFIKPCANWHASYLADYSYDRVIYYEFQYSVPGGGPKWSKLAYLWGKDELEHVAVSNIISKVAAVRRAMINGIAE